jgi:hypothetical protein
VGPLARPLPLRCHVHSKLSFPSLFANLIETLSQAAHHQDAAAESFAAEAGEDVSPISFVLPGAMPTIAHQQAEGLHLLAPLSPYDLSFHLQATPTSQGAPGTPALVVGCLSIPDCASCPACCGRTVEATVLFNQGLYHPERARELIRQIRSLLSQVMPLPLGLWQPHVV